MTSFAFDNNTWYQIQSPSKPNQSIYADWVTGADGGTAVFFNATSNTNTGQQFQFYNPSNYSLNTFILRANRPGSSMYFSASNPKHTPSQIGSTRPSMKNAFFLKEDFGCVWNVTAWGGDGTYYLSNYANGTNWHLAVDDDGLLFMDSNLSADDSHKFTFQNVGNGIYNPSYSYVQTPTSAPAPGQANPSMLGMSPAPTSFSNDGSCSYSTTASAAPGLSPATSAGIAAAVTATVCGIIMAAVIFFLLRRRDEARNQEHGWPGASGSRQWQKVGELDASSKHSAELDHAQMSKMELYGDSPTATINTMNSTSTFGHVRRASSTERLAKVAFESPSRVRASYRSYR